MDYSKFSEVFSAYLEKFGSPPYIGLSDEAMPKLLKEMKRALAGERKGNISYEEFYGKFDKDTLI